MLCEGCGRNMASCVLETDLATSHWQIFKVCETCCHNTEYLRKSYLYRKQREGAWERVGNQICPTYNRAACKFFDRLNEVLGWNGEHAENGHERILERKGMPLYPDYFDEQNKVIIEWLESYHFANSGEIEKSVNRLGWYRTNFPDYAVFFIPERWLKTQSCYEKLMSAPSAASPAELRKLLQESQGVLLGGEQ